jgi:hypothetical protein
MEEGLTDADYDALLASLQRRFDAMTKGKQGKAPLFTTNSGDLFAAFLAALPDDQRPSHTCAACRRFVERFGGLVQVTAKGKTTSVMWDPANVPDPYRPAIAALEAAVVRAPIVGVFLSTQTVWGQPVTGDWQHFSVEPASALAFEPSVVQTVEQRIAELREDHATLKRGLEEFPLKLVVNAHTALTTGSLFRSEKCIGVAKWLMDLHKQLRKLSDNRIRDNHIWVAVATAPPGFCHVRSTMIGTLLEDLAKGLPFPEIKAKFDAKLHPLQYQRPTAAPSAGNIARAEKIVAQLKSAGALERRFAKLADIVPLWTPKGAISLGTPQGGVGKVAKDGVFSHLRTKERSSKSEALEIPAVTMTWDKFSRIVLPTAEVIEYRVPSSKEPYSGMVTAKRSDAPPIIQWDAPGRRNPVTWYVYHGGSLPKQWNLEAGVYHPVSAVTLAPWMWHAKAGASSHHGEAVLFILAGAKDTGYERGAGFFPEFLKHDYHEIRATIEAYAKSAVVEGKDDAEACGLVLQKNATWNYEFRVTSKDGVRVEYKLDRWD